MAVLWMTSLIFLENCNVIVIVGVCKAFCKTWKMKILLFMLTMQKIGEDISVPKVVKDVLSPVHQLLAEPFIFQEGKRKYLGRKTKKAVHRSQCQHEVLHNAHRIWILLYPQFTLTP